MAKAALAMMTLTSARDYAKEWHLHERRRHRLGDRDEDPAAISARKQVEHDFQPPSTSSMALREVL